jgi:hypothetical protein
MKANEIKKHSSKGRTLAMVHIGCVEGGYLLTKENN